MKSILASSAVVGLVAGLLASTVYAQGISPKEQIEYRQAGYSFMSWNMQKIKANLDGTYNKDQVVAAANAIDGIANSGMGALYGPGTDKDVDGVVTHVKPEFFQNMDEVGKVAREFIAAADNMAKVAAEGDKGATAAAFGRLGKSCKSCHDKFRMKMH